MSTNINMKYCILFVGVISILFVCDPIQNEKQIVSENSRVIGCRTALAKQMFILPDTIPMDSFYAKAERIYWNYNADIGFLHILNTRHFASCVAKMEMFVEKEDNRCVIKEVDSYSGPQPLCVNCPYDLSCDIPNISVNDSLLLEFEDKTYLITTSLSSGMFIVDSTATYEILQTH